ncbi:MAG: sugar transferase [Actinomycetota bacterium]|nr:sugar transferase [Actinomycetota bacterium]
MTLSSTAPRSAAHRLYVRLWHFGFRWLYVVDSVGILVVVVAVMVARFGTKWPEPTASWVGIVVVTVLVQLVFYFGGLYEKQVRLGQRMWFPRVAGLTLVGLAVSAVLVLPTGRYPVPRANLPLIGGFVALFATGSRALSRRLRARRFGPPRVLLVGGDEQTSLAADHLDESDRDAMVAARVADGRNLLSEIEQHQATDIVFVDDVVVEDLFPEPAGTLDARGVGAYLRVTATSALMGLREVREIGGMPYVALRSRALRPHQVRLKRLVELLVLLAVSPFVLLTGLFIAVWLRACAGSGVVLHQRRIGLGGKPFTLLKFRTMALDAEDNGGVRLASRDDDRVLRGCRWLRRTRLDELPQLWNVVRGEMSLVGPRPERPELVAEFELAIPGYGRRHEIPPGITGLAQTRAGYHTDPAYKLGHDLQYLMSWSPILDLQILARTILVMVLRRS